MGDRDAKDKNYQSSFDKDNLYLILIKESKYLICSFNIFLAALLFKPDLCDQYFYNE